MPRVKVPVPIEDTETAAAKPVPAVVPEPPVPQPVQTLPPEPKQQGPRRFTNQQLLIAGFGLLVLILLLAVVNLTKDRNRLQTQVKSPSSSAGSASSDIKQLTTQIGQYFELPANETPTLATVTDVTKVQGQSFFKNAKNGDKVLLYSKAGEAILYRPSTKKIITIAPVNLNSNSSSTTTGTSDTGTLPAPAQ